MPTKFSQFNTGGAIQAGDLLVGIRNGQDTQFNAQSLPNLAWNTLIIGQPLLINMGYFLANGAPANYALPTVAAVGQVIQIVNVASVFTLTQAAGQQVFFGNLTTTLGIGGSLTSNTGGDSLTLVCLIANTNYILLGGAEGNWVVT